MNLKLQPTFFLVVSISEFTVLTVSSTSLCFEVFNIIYSFNFHKAKIIVFQKRNKTEVSTMENDLDFKSLVSSQSMQFKNLIELTIKTNRFQCPEKINTDKI